jgi:hypothetical protein
MALVTIVVTYLVLRGLGEPWIRSNFLSLGVLSVVASGFIRRTFSCLCLVLLVALHLTILLTTLPAASTSSAVFRSWSNSGNSSPSTLGVSTTPPDNGCNSLGSVGVEIRLAPGLVLECHLRWSSILMTSSCPTLDDRKILRNRSDRLADMMRSTVSS